jgi:hypothetical protein
MSYDFEQVSVFIDGVTARGWVCEEPDGPIIDPPGRIYSSSELSSFTEQCQAAQGIVRPWAVDVP